MGRTPEALTYTIEGCSSYSATFKPENILVDTPNDLSSRWSSQTATEASVSPAILKDRPWLLLKLDKVSIIRSIAFGKCQKAHPCNVKELRILGGLKPEAEDMELLCQPCLKNDAIPEAFLARPAASGIAIPCRYIRIEPLSAHSPKYNISLWHVALHGWSEEVTVDQVIQAQASHKEVKTLKLIMKHLRNKGLMTAFEALNQSVASTFPSFTFEHPLLASLHTALVRQGDFDMAEAILSRAAFRPISTLDQDDADPNEKGPTLFTEYMEEVCSPRPIWKRLDENAATFSVDGERPSPRGGHQLVFVPRNEERESCFYLFGGWNGQEELDDLWRFDIDVNAPGTGRWALVSRSTHKDGGPMPRSCHKACLHEKTGDIYVLGRFVDQRDRGDENSSTAEKPAVFPCDFWKFSTRGASAGTWIKLSDDIFSQGGPRLIYDHQMVVDNTGDALYLFGGKIVGSETDAEYSGLYMFDLTAQTWKLLQPDPIHHQVTNTPERLMSRIGHSLVLDEARRLLYIFAGQRNDFYLSDLWTFDLNTHVPTQITSDYSLEGGPSGAFTQRATFDRSLDECYLLAGLTIDKRRRNAQSANSLWIRRMESGRWIRVQSLLASSDYSPMPRFAHQMIYDLENKTHYLFGGNPSTVNTAENEAPPSRLGDLWMLKLARPQKEDVLQRAKFIVRKQRFVEMCRTHDTMQALIYLQTSLSSVTDHDDPVQAAAYRHCMHHLLAAGPNEDEDMGENMTDDAFSSHAEDQDAFMASSQDFDFGTGLVDRPVDRKSWDQRNATFAKLLEFFPLALQQPRDNILDSVN